MILNPSFFDQNRTEPLARNIFRTPENEECLPFSGIKRDDWIAELADHPETKYKFVNFGSGFNRREHQPYIEINPYKSTSLDRLDDSNMAACILNGEGHRHVGSPPYDDRETKVEMLLIARRLLQKSFPEGQEFRVISNFIEKYCNIYLRYEYTLIALAVLLNPLDARYQDFVSPEEWDKVPGHRTLVLTSIESSQFVKRVILLGNIYVNVWKKLLTENLITGKISYNWDESSRI